MVPKNEEKTMRHQIQIQGGQSNSQPAMSNGQVSDHMGQQATDVQMQSGNSNGQSSAGGQDAQREVQTAAH
jgi:HSP20 family protein